MSAPTRSAARAKQSFAARDVATGRPVAQRGLLAYARVGATATNPLALRLLSNS